MTVYPHRYHHNPWNNWFAYPLMRHPYRYRAATQTRETEEAYYVEIWLPGLSRNDIQLVAKGNQLEIEGVRNRNMRLWGLSRTVLQRSIVLPADADPKRIDAKFRNGRLMIRLAKYGAELTSWEETDYWSNIELGIKRAVALMKQAWDQLVSVLKHGL